MSEDCYHDTSVSNVYTAAWQEIVKLKALELRVLLSEQLLAIVGTERSDRPQLIHRTCFSSFCSSEKLFSKLSMLWNATVAKFLTVAGRMMNASLPEAKASATSLCFSKNFLDPILSLSNIRALSNSTAPTCA